MLSALQLREVLPSKPPLLAAHVLQRLSLAFLVRLETGLSHSEETSCRL